MSKESWLAEFYPVPARDFEGDALDHSILKWTGLLIENLNKHEVTLEAAVVCTETEAFLEINSDSCVLCIRYVSTFCAMCPIVKVRGARCDEMTETEKEKGSIADAPYQQMASYNNAQPMLDLLEEANLKTGQLELRF